MEPNSKHIGTNHALMCLLGYITNHVSKFEAHLICMILQQDVHTGTMYECFLVNICIVSGDYCVYCK
jgi:hypothetical protein